MPSSASTSMHSWKKSRSPAIVSIVSSRNYVKSIHGFNRSRPCCTFLLEIGDPELYHPRGLRHSTGAIQRVSLTILNHLRPQPALAIKTMRKVSTHQKGMLVFLPIPLSKLHFLILGQDRVSAPAILHRSQPGSLSLERLLLCFPPQLELPIHGLNCANSAFYWHLDGWLWSSFRDDV